MKNLVTALLLGCFLTCLPFSECISRVDRGYVFTAPKWLLAGETESGCLSLHNLEPPAHVLLELLSPSSGPEGQVLASTSNVMKTGVETCLKFVVPSAKYSKAKLRLKIKFEKYPDYVIESEKEVHIEHDSLITFVETDKPVYKPGQDVNIRVLMLKHDLKPWKKPIPKIWIENPSEVRVAQWTNVSTEHGMVQLVFPLSTEPSSGTWKIKVEKKKWHLPLIHTTAFEVKKYVLPRFQVTISSPGYILADAENVTWNICAKYSYGKPVKGTLLLKSMPQIPSWRQIHNLPEIYYETGLDSPDGCTEFVLSGAVLGLAHWRVAPNNIVLMANFTEAGTGVVETSISRTAVMQQALKLEFAPYTPKFFKLGLPYHGKLRVLRQDDVPAPNEKIQLCLRVRGKDEWLPVVVECRNFTSSTDGFVDFIVPPPQRNIVLLSFVATAVDYPTKYYSPDKRWRIFMDQPRAYIDVNPWYSPSYSYLTVTRGNQPIVCGEKYSFNVMYTMPANSKNNEFISFYYSINSKGDILIYGHVDHKPSRDTILNYSEFRNLLGAVEPPANKTEQDSVVHRFPLSVKVTPSMAPFSELLLYYVRADGEIVATTYKIEVGHCFENKVKTAWHTDVQSPGSTTQFHVESAPWSYCGISAVDKSTIFLGGSKSNLVDADKAFEQLKRIHPDPETRHVWRESYCEMPLQPGLIGDEIDHLPFPGIRPVFFRRRRHLKAFPEYHPRGGVDYVDAIQAFDDFGAVVMSDLVLQTRPCPELTLHYSDDMKMMSGMKGDQTDRVVHAARKMPLAFPLLNFAVAAAAMGPEVGYVDQIPEPPATLRSYFPETWLWELVPTGKEGKVTINRELPHTITDWVGYTTCISPVLGLGIAPPTAITAFQPFFLDYSLPYSVKRGEMLRMKVSLFNYMQHSLPVKIKLEDATGLDLHLSHAVASFCVNARDSVVQEYILRPRVLGEVNITVSASIDPEYAEPCGPETLIYTRDVIVKPILVLPEGFPVEVTKSAFICPKNFSDDSAIMWNLDLPIDLVPESGRAYVTLTGDILGPALENLDNLVQLPVGCGEQNMILFVPNIHAIAYLDATGIENPELRAKALKNMEKGYQRELIYRHPEGSYSAFGPKTPEDDSSIWLTAFVVKSFAQARNLIHIDDHDLKLSVKWMVKKQLENGCFPVIGRVFHKQMKGGLQDDDSSSSALTAYILISLLESGVLLSASVINNALYCLEKGMANNNNSPYTAALSTYALALLEHPKANSSMKNLMERATRHNDLLWWEDKSKPSTGLSIEMTAYAILSLIKLGGDSNMVEALKAVRWMSKQRNAEGGFASTQDTVLGLEALTKYAIAMNTSNTDLSILVTAGEIDHIYRMHTESRMVLTQIRLPVLPTVVEVFAEGEGCVLVQSNMKYNVAHATGSEAFDLSVAAASISSVNECSMQKITICARYKMADEESNMALLEVGMISGYVPDRSSLHALLEDPLTKVKRFEEDRGIVMIYFDKLTGQKTCISFTVTRKDIVDRLEPANVKLYDYYQQELTVSSSYSFAQTCHSADADEEPSVPNPMPVELQVTLLKNPSSEKQNIQDDRTIEKSIKSIAKESSNTKNKLVNNIHEADNKSASVSSKKGNDRDTVEDEQSIEARPKMDNVPLVENSNVKMNEREMDSIANVHTSNDNSIVIDNSENSQMESGSGLIPDEPDTNLHVNFDKVDRPVEIGETPSAKSTENPNYEVNPSFVVVNHELETPDGMEGPVPVYVKPETKLEDSQTADLEDHRSGTTIVNNILFKLTPTPKMERNQSTKSEDKSQEEPEPTEPGNSGTTSVKQSCPTCADNLPEDINEIYCSANSAVKVAVRRLRRARLLLDLKASSESIRRLCSTAEFILDSNCSCPPLDNPGSVALVINKDKNFLSPGERSKQVVDSSFSIYGLELVSGVPRRITEARAACSRFQEDGSDADSPVGG